MEGQRVSCSTLTRLRYTEDNLLRGVICKTEHPTRAGFALPALVRFTDEFVYSFKNKLEVLLMASRACLRHLYDARSLQAFCRCRRPFMTRVILAPRCSSLSLCLLHLG